jgi:hypothetical protein
MLLFRQFTSSGPRVSCGKGLEFSRAMDVYDSGWCAIEVILFVPCLVQTIRSQARGRHLVVSSSGRTGIGKSGRGGKGGMEKAKARGKFRECPFRFERCRRLAVIAAEFSRIFTPYNTFQSSRLQTIPPSSQDQTRWILRLIRSGC